ncbi:MAG: hypothetical protein CMP11_00625 [Zetaproteobacteria bacterium]|nr:hypothetical protein [Pseudobdellovibrionaceae bacterium]|tara:strand:+ start:195 stop:389 length:195 start_codon:yes stop_codon:yes gene_type:complete
MAEQQIKNVISLDKPKTSIKKPKNNQDEVTFEKYIRQNLQLKEKLSKERKETNQKILRAYKIRP